MGRGTRGKTLAIKPVGAVVFAAALLLLLGLWAVPQAMTGGYDSCLTVEFMRALAMNSRITLHQKCEYGDNAHHITEALFKSLGRALKEAVRIEGGDITSTKGAL